MSTLYCVKKCFFRDRIWEPGETLVPSPGEKVPPFFQDSMTPKKIKPVQAEPKTLSEMTKQESNQAPAPVVKGSGSVEDMFN